jgi:hypothetical protein
MNEFWYARHRGSVYDGNDHKDISSNIFPHRNLFAFEFAGNFFGGEGKPHFMPFENGVLRVAQT